jgi:glycosyltransferase involved in cell wall biosynthesis
MSSSTCRVSIGLPVYNGASFLSEAIQTVLNQTFEDFELIISDNASTDSTEQICRMFAMRDSRIRYYRGKENIGAARNFNKVFELSKGKYFKWLSADDAMEPEFLERSVRVLEETPEVVLVCSRYINRNELNQSEVVVDDNHRLRIPDAYGRLSELLKRVPGKLVPIWGLIRSQALRKTRLIRPFIGADECLVIELALLGEFEQLPEYLLRTRDHADAYHTFQWKNRMQEGVREAKWYDSRNREGIYFPYWRRLREYSLLILRCDERRSRKFRMLAGLIARFGRKRWKNLVKDLIFVVGLGPVLYKLRITINRFLRRELRPHW